MKKQWIFGLLLLLVAAFLVYLFAGQNVKEDENVVKIGAILPLTENAVALGNSTLRGIELAVEEYNNLAAKNNDKKVVLEVFDSKGNQTEGVNQARKLFAIGSKPKLVYSIMSGVTLAIQPITEEANVPLIAAVGTEKLLKNSNFSYRNYISPENIGIQLSGLLKDTLKIDNLGIYYSNNDFGQSVKNSVEKESKNKRIVINFTEPFDEKSLDYKTIVLKNKSFNTQCVYVAGVGKALGTLIRQIRESGYNGLIVGDPTIPFPDVVNSAGQYIQGINYLDFAFDINSRDSSTVKFVNSYRQKFNQEPQNFSVIAYDAMRAILAKAKVNNYDFVKILAAMNKEQGTFGEFVLREKEFFYTTKIKTYQILK